MDTSQVLDLFTVEGKKEKKNVSTSNNKNSMSEILENLGELWDEKQYENEFDLGGFMDSLKS